MSHLKRLLLVTPALVVSFNLQAGSLFDEPSGLWATDSDLGFSSDTIEWASSSDSTATGSEPNPGFSYDPDPFGIALPFSLAQASDADAAASGLSPEEQAEMAAIGEALANPLSYLWLMFTQLDTIKYEGDVLDALGEDEIINHTLLVQPVLSLQLTQEWKAVIRPVIPINSFETVDNVDLSTGGVFDPVGVDLERETGIGDIVLWTAFSKQYKPPNIFGFGVTAMFDTATDDALGTGKNSIGPMALAFSITEKWILGVVAQHWESVGGSDHRTINTDAGPVRVDRPDVSLTDVQPVVRYRVNQLTNIGLAPNWRYNHETDQASIPIGLGFDTLVKWGKLPIKMGVEFYTYAESDDDFGGDSQIRFLFIPVLPSPEWSRDPIFN